MTVLLAPQASVDPSERVLAWLRDQDVRALPDAAVPGTTAAERRLLAALGRAAGSLVFERRGGLRNALRNDCWPQAVLDWTAAYASTPSALMDHLARAVQENADVLGTIYCSVVQHRNRRRLGTFFTPSPLVNHMVSTAERVLGASPKAVVDVGAGVGAFTLVAASTWPARIIAVDINVVTLGLLGAAAHLHGVPLVGPASQGADTAQVSLIHADFLSWVRRGIRDLHTPTLILGNPPYTRHQGLGAATKLRAHKTAGALVPSGLAGMSAYFLGASLLNMREDDALCLLLPTNWLDANYGRELRRHLWQLRTRRVELHVFPHELDVFPGTQVSAVVLTVGPARPINQLFSISSAHLHDEVVTTTELATYDRQDDEPPTFSQLVAGNPVPVAARKPRSGTVLLGDIATIRRGVATGCNNLFFLSDVSAADLPSTAFSAALLRPGHVTGDTLDVKTHDAIGNAGRPRWLLDFHGYTSSPFHELPSTLRDLLQAAMTTGVTNRRLISDRDPWWIVEQISVAPILLGPMTKSMFRIILNTVGAVHSNTLYGIAPLDPALDAQRLAAWLRTTAAQKQLLAVARKQATGLHKLEPRALRHIEVPVELT